MAAVSVISSSSERASNPVARSVRRTMSTSVWSWSCRAPMLTDMRSGLPTSRCQERPWLQASPRTHSPIWASMPGVLATGMKSSGCTHAALGVAPADERLDADDLLRRGGDQRLVLEEELVALERPVQLGLQREAVGLLLVEAGMEELPAGASSVRGPAHRRLGVAQQLGGGGAVGGVEGDSQAEREEELALVELERVADRAQEAVHGGRGLGRAGRPGSSAAKAPPPR